MTAVWEKRRNNIEFAVIFSLQIILFPNPLRNKDDRWAWTYIENLLHSGENIKGYIDRYR